MQRTKKIFLSLITILVLFLSGALFAPLFQNAKTTVHAEIPSSQTGFVPTRDKSEETVYHLFRSTKTDLKTVGKEIMFIGGTGLENTMVVPVVPPGSAKLRITASGKAYITSPSVVCYVDVIERGNGFDWCETGTLNGNNDEATEYSC